MGQFTGTSSRLLIFKSIWSQKWYLFREMRKAPIIACKLDTGRTKLGVYRAMRRLLSDRTSCFFTFSVNETPASIVEIYPSTVREKSCLNRLNMSPPKQKEEANGKHAKKAESPEGNDVFPCRASKFPFHESADA